MENNQLSSDITRREALKKIGVGLVAGTGIGVGFIPESIASRGDTKNPRINDYSWVRGFNYQPSNGINGLQVWERFDRVLYRTELSRGKQYFPGMNTVRIWLSMDAWLSDRKKFLENIASATGIIEDLGLKIIPVIFNGWFGIPVFGGLTCEVVGVEKNQNNYGIYRAYLTDAVIALTPYQNSILMWDLCNEPLNNAPTENNKELWADFLKTMGRTVREKSSKIPVTIGNQWASQEFVTRFGDIHDVFSLHPYYPYGAPTPEAYEKKLDDSLAAINQTGKPVLVTECCWGSLDDKERVGFIRYALEVFTKRRLGFIPHILHHTLVADGHRPEYGHVGVAGYMAFIEADGSLRHGHEIYNKF